MSSRLPAGLAVFFLLLCLCPAEARRAAPPASGDAEQWYQAGAKAFFGLGGRMDNTEAARCFKKSAEMGHPQAAFGLAFLTAVGVGVTTDQKTADDLVKKAMPAVREQAKKGDAAAMNWLGLAFREAAGDRNAVIELNIRVFFLSVTDDPASVVDGISAMFSIGHGLVTASPFTLIGPVSAIVEEVLRLREELGFSYLIVGQNDIEPFAPVVAALAGT